MCRRQRNASKREEVDQGPSPHIPSGPRRDFSLKEGQTISISFGGGSKSSSSSQSSQKKSSSSAANSDALVPPLLPPPPPPSRKWVHHQSPTSRPFSPLSDRLWPPLHGAVHMSFCILSSLRPFVCKVSRFCKVSVFYWQKIGRNIFSVSRPYDNAIKASNKKRNPRENRLMISSPQCPMNGPSVDFGCDSIHILTWVKQIDLSTIVALATDSALGNIVPFHHSDAGPNAKLICGCDDKYR